MLGKKEICEEQMLILANRFDLVSRSGGKKQFEKRKIKVLRKTIGDLEKQTQGC